MTSSGKPSSHELEPSRPDWLAELIASDEPRWRVHVCFGKSCTPGGANAVYAAFQTAVRAEGIDKDVELLATTCRNRCELGVSVNVYPGPTWYGLMTADRVARVVREHLVGGKPVPDFVVTEEQVIDARA